MNKVRVGIGGWTFPPWRDNFYPKGLPQARELAYASERLGAIEINATYHGTQKPESFARWAEATPPGFVFTVKASRFCTNRKLLCDVGESVERFLAQGITRLGDKLGPILWQFMATKRFELDDFAAFLALLPRERDGVRLRHAVEPRHESFLDPRFFALARDHDVAVVCADTGSCATIDEFTSDFVYLRLQDAREEEPLGYTEAELDRWAETARGWAEERDVFLFFINGAKVRAPAAAQALIARLEGRS